MFHLVNVFHLVTECPMPVIDSNNCHDHMSIKELAFLMDFCIIYNATNINSINRFDI